MARKNRYSLVARITDRIGRRGLVLLLLSTAFLIIGFKTIIAPAMNMPHEFMLYNDIPPVVRSIMWFSAALCGIFAAVLRKGANDALGFAALCVPTTIVAASYFMAYIGVLFGIPGTPFYWVDALEWGVILSLLVIVSGWEEVDDEFEYYRLTDTKESQ